MSLNCDEIYSLILSISVPYNNIIVFMVRTSHTYRATNWILIYTNFRTEHAAGCEEQKFIILLFHFMHVQCNVVLMYSK